MPPFLLSTVLSELIFYGTSPRNKEFFSVNVTRIGLGLSFLSFTYLPIRLTCFIFKLPILIHFVIKSSTHWNSCVFLSSMSLVSCSGTLYIIIEHPLLLFFLNSLMASFNESLIVPLSTPVVGTFILAISAYVSLIFFGACMMI